MRFFALLVVLVVAYGGMTAVGIIFGFVGLAEGVIRTTSVAGGFALGWMFRGDP